MQKVTQNYCTDKLSTVTFTLKAFSPFESHPVGSFGHGRLKKRSDAMTTHRFD